MLVVSFLFVALMPQPTRAATWIEESPGCYKPFDLGGNCTYWNYWNPPAYDKAVTCLSHGRNLSNPKTFCWWNTRIMAHFTEKEDAKFACRASKKAMGSNNTCWPGNYEGTFNRVFSYKKVKYRFLVHKDGCPAGMVNNGANECVAENTHASLNAGACSAGVPTDGNPIHVGTGNKYQHEIDLAPSGPGNTLGFSRHYNSRPANLVGARWRHAYGSQLKLRPIEVEATNNGAREVLRDTLQMIRPDGRAILFYRTGEYELATTDADIPAGIPAMGTDQYPLHWTGSEWRYRNGDGDLEYYDDEGKLLRIVGHSGFTQYIEKDAFGRVLEVHDDFGRSLNFEYKDDDYQDGGRLLQMTGPAGEVYQYGYDTNGNLTRVTYPDGSIRTYHYGEFDAPAGFLTGITDENGNRYATWKYDNQGRAILSEHAGGAERTEIEYRNDGAVAITDASGNVRTYTLTQVRGRVLADIIDNGCSSCGSATDWDYNDQGLVTRKEDQNGNVTTYEYNQYGLETSRTEAAGTADARTITTEWDTGLRLPVEVIEPTASGSPGLRTQYTYDARGRRLSMTETDLVTGKNRTTTWSYHPDSPDGVPGQLAAIDGPRTHVNDVTTFDYDAQGNRTRVTNAPGHVTEITDHDAYGRPLRLVDPNGLVTELAYDPRGRLLSRDVGGEITTFAYDGVGNLTAIALPDGSELHYEYDAAQRLVALTDDEGHRIDYTLDAAGNRTEQNVHADSGTLVRTQQQVFDELNRLIQTVGAQGQTTTHGYDRNGNRVATTDPAGDAIQHTFDALDRLTQITDPMGGITTYEYDQSDRITAVTDPNGNTTRYTYNAFGDRTEVDSPDSGITTYQYDVAGNVIERTDAKGQTTTYQYDAGNRLLHAQYSDGATVDYAWDTGTNGVGRLSRIDEQTADGSTHATAWAYDQRGRVVEHTQTVDSLILRTQHTYDSAGRRIQTIYPSGRVVTYTHDRDEVTGIAVDGETVLSGADYQPFGSISGWTWGDGDDHQRSYDLDGRLIQHSLADGSPAGGNRILDYTPDHNIASISGPQLARNYGYDGLDRLIAAHDPDRTDAYAYDANGNRTERIEAGDIETYTTESGSNRLLQTSSNSATVDYSYDQNGNLIDDGTHSYTYSARNRLVAVDDGNTGTYRYNALGQRIRKQAGSGTDGSTTDYAQLATEAQAQADEFYEIAASLDERADYYRSFIVEPPGSDSQAAQNETYRLVVEAFEYQISVIESEADDYQQKADEYTALANGSGGSVEVQYFVYNEGGQLIGRYDSTGAAIREYFWLGAMPVAAMENDELYYIHSDHLGTPRAVSKPNSAVVWSWISDAFGDTEPDEDSDGDGETFKLNFRFPGQYFDVQTGTQQNWWRSYAPSGGRYAETDPIGLADGTNPYVYARNNPLTFYDRDGNRAENIFGRTPSVTPPSAYGGSSAQDFDFEQRADERQSRCYTRCVVQLLNPVPFKAFEVGAKVHISDRAGAVTKKGVKLFSVAIATTCIKRCSERSCDE